MLKEDREIKNDLVTFYNSCLLFKKYDQYNLWFGDFYEYSNIKYCKKYFQKYVYFWIYFFLLQRFSIFFVKFLYKSPYFIKFVESGFFKYLNYHFLLSFYNNNFIFDFDLKGKQKIKIFVKFYFQNFLKRRLKKDLLLLLTKVISDIILNLLIKLLINRLKFIQIYVRRVWLNDKILVKNKKEVYFIGLFYFNYLIKKSYYNLFFTHLDNLYKLKFVYKLLLKSKPINFNENKILSINLKPVKVNILIREKFFIGLPQKLFYFNNKDIQYLIESFELLPNFNEQEKNISLYQKSNILFEDSLLQEHLIFKKSFKIFKLFFKSFNFCFIKYKYKKKL